MKFKERGGYYTFTYDIYIHTFYGNFVITRSKEKNHCSVLISRASKLGSSNIYSPGVEQ